MANNVLENITTDIILKENEKRTFSAEEIIEIKRNFVLMEENLTNAIDAFAKGEEKVVYAYFAKAEESFEDISTVLKIEHKPENLLQIVTNIIDVVKDDLPHLKVIPMAKIACNIVDAGWIIFSRYEKETDIYAKGAARKTFGLGKSFFGLKDEICPRIKGISNDYDANVEKFGGLFIDLATLITNPLSLYNLPGATTPNLNHDEL